LINRYRMTQDGRHVLLHAAVQPLRYQVEYYRGKLAEAQGEPLEHPYRGVSNHGALVRLRKRASRALRYYETMLYLWVPEDEHNEVWYQVRNLVEELGFLIGYYKG